MPWSDFNENIRGASSGFADYARQEKAKTDTFQMLLFKAKAEQMIKQSDPYQMALSGLMNEFIEKMKRGKQSGQNITDTTGGIVEPERGQEDYTLMPTFGSEGVSFKTELSPQAQMQQKVKEAKAIELSKGIPADKSGLYNLAKESLTGIDNVINILYPTGEPKSFKRGIAFGSNLPAISLPFIGPITPKMSPIRSAQMQDVFRDTGAALAGRQLIQTGVAARPDETENLRNQFAASLTSNPKATLEGLRKLKTFYKNYIYILETKGLIDAQKWSQSQPSIEEDYRSILQMNKSNTNKTSSGMGYTVER